MAKSLLIKGQQFKILENLGDSRHLISKLIEEQGNKSNKILVILIYKTSKRTNINKREISILLAFI